MLELFVVVVGIGGWLELLYRRVPVVRVFVAPVVAYLTFPLAFSEEILYWNATPHGNSLMTCDAVSGDGARVRQWAKQGQDSPQGRGLCSRAGA